MSPTRRRADLAGVLPTSVESRKGRPIDPGGGAARRLDIAEILADGG
jgi:hypothetical protein